VLRYIQKAHTYNVGRKQNFLTLNLLVYKVTNGLYTVKVGFRKVQVGGHET